MIALPNACFIVKDTEAVWSAAPYVIVVVYKKRIGSIAENLRLKSLKYPGIGVKPD
jgi:hypothetical protein